MSKTEAIGLQNYSYESIKKGSLSFSFASTIFGRKTRDKVVKLYAWCRYVDDQIDDKHSSLINLKWRLERIRKLSFDRLVTSALPPAIAAFRELHFSVPLSQNFAEELLRGMEMDLNQTRYKTLAELEVYCYRVAGVVGLMMSEIMGVSDPRAYVHAKDLGLAMQITNIARDVLTDARMGRIYLPEDKLSTLGIPASPEFFESLEVRPGLAEIVAELLDHAERLYQSGDKGLKYLPFRSAIAVGIAREVYSSIGTEVRKRGAKAWDKRVYIPLPQKCVLAIRGISKAVRSRFQNSKADERSQHDDNTEHKLGSRS